MAKKPVRKAIGKQLGKPKPSVPAKKGVRKATAKPLIKSLQPKRLTAKQIANQERLEKDLQQLRSGSLPIYVPHKRRGQKGRRYRNTQTGEVVSDYYYSKVLNKNLRDQSQVTYSSQTERAYRQQTRRAQIRERNKSKDLVDTFSLRSQVLGNPMSDAEIRNDERFDALVEELRYWSTWERIFATPENLAKYTGIGSDDLIDALLIQQAGKTPEQVRLEAYNKIISHPEYKRVLTELGRRDPADDRDIGTYGPGYIKAVVVPYYQGRLEG
jgi:hypothetical protein